jgi:hypothetical protein
VELEYDCWVWGLAVALASGMPAEELENGSRAGWRVRGEVGRGGGDVDGSEAMGAIAAGQVEEETGAWDPHISEMRDGISKGNLVHTNIRPPPIRL